MTNGIPVKSGMVLLGALFFLVIVFQNCNPHFKSPDSQPKNTFNKTNNHIVSSCLVGLNFKCRINHYAPDLLNQHSLSEVCIQFQSDEGEKTICSPLEQWDYDSSEALSFCKTCTAEDGLEGGKYNYFEIACSDKSKSLITERIQAKEVDPRSFLNEAIQHCLLNKE